MNSSTLVIRPDIASKYGRLFGAKTVNGRQIVAEDLMAQLIESTRNEFARLLRERHELQDKVARHQASYSFLPASERVSDADGNTATVGEIRQGMLDGFRRRKTAAAWQVSSQVPIPADTMRPGLEGTGPAIDLGMAMGALNTGAASWMWDWEDAGGDYKDQLYQGWENLRAILAHEWDGKPYLHPTKMEKDRSGKTIPGKAREYRIELPPSKWPTIFVRVPGLHLRNRQISMNGEPTPAMIPALVIHALNNWESQKKNGSGIYYYVPKVETWQEARLVARLLKELERALGLQRGTLKIKMLNERAEYALQEEVILWCCGRT